MNEQDFYKKLDEIHKSIVETQQVLKQGWWKSFFHGTLSGFGSVVGAVLALAILGWMLNAIGVVPAFRDQMKRFDGLLKQAEQTRLPNINSSK